MVRSLLVRGMLVGLGAGLLALVVALLIGEPQVDHAIAFEDSLVRLHHEAADPQVVSRGVQKTWGLATGLLTMSVALGGVFALVFAYAYGRMGALQARGTALVLAGLAFLTLTLVPFSKYPPNPPSVGNPDTIGHRTWLYFTMIAIGIVSVVAAVRVRRSLAQRWGGWNATIAGGVCFLVLVAVAELILPGVDEVPRRFSAVVLWHFRVASLAINATLWTGLGLGFGAAAEHLLGGRDRRLASERAASPAG